MIKNALPNKKIAHLLAFAILLPSYTNAAPDLVRIEEYKSNIKAGCLGAGTKKNHPIESTTKICECILFVLNKNYTLAEWELSAKLDGEGKLEEGSKIFAPHIPEIENCRDSK